MASSSSSSSSLIPEDNQDEKELFYLTQEDATPQFPDPKATNSLLAKEMNALTMSERERVYEEVHGISKAIVEEPTFVAKSLDEFQLQLEEVQNKPAYDIAKRQSPSYVDGRPLRLMFLRATDFHPKKAVRRYVDFFQHKQMYFGDEVLGRPILYSDLNKDDIEALKSGWLQAVPFRDNSGRTIIWETLPMKYNKTVMNSVRAAWYFAMCMLEDDETQKHGAVIVNFGVESMDLSEETRAIVWRLSCLIDYMPFKLVSCHFCVHSKLTHPVIALIQLFAGKELRTRCRIHLGTIQECLYSLVTFGINVSHAPMLYNGEVKTKNLKQWLRRRQRSDAFIALGANHVTNQIELPGPRDILYGRGVFTQQHTGNIWFHRILDDFREQYATATTNTDKKEIAQNLLDWFQKQNARFLERDSDGWWVELTKDVALKKIGERLGAKPPVHSSISSNNKNDNDEDNDIISPLSVSNNGENACTTMMRQCCKPPAKRAKIYRMR